MAAVTTCGWIIASDWGGRVVKRRRAKPVFFLASRRAELAPLLYLIWSLGSVIIKAKSSGASSALREGGCNHWSGVAPLLHAGSSANVFYSASRCISTASAASSRLLRRRCAATAAVPPLVFRYFAPIGQIDLIEGLLHRLTDIGPAHTMMLSTGDSATCIGRGTKRVALGDHRLLLTRKCRRIDEEK